MFSKGNKTFMGLLNQNPVGGMGQLWDNWDIASWSIRGLDAEASTFFGGIVS
jgi:hypothetical protein